ncbi:MAG: hypothetical protein AB7F96_10795 [Beijerinckiaceae bacterium]
MAEDIRSMARDGFMQHDIAAKLRINQGRVSEVLNGKRFASHQLGLFDEEE